MQIGLSLALTRPPGKGGGGQPTLQAISLSPASATAGQPYSGTITGNTAGSTITATSSDGTTLTVVGTTVTGTFAAVGTPTITLTETLGGASNSPKQTALPFQVNSAATSPSAMAGTVMFLDATDTSTITQDSSNNVSQWKDKSSSALTLSQTTASNQPTNDTAKKAVIAPTRMATMNLPAVPGTKLWSLAVIRLNFAQLASADGSLAYINASARNPYVNYTKASKQFGFQWRTSAAINYAINWVEGTDFPANQYFAVVSWIDTANGVIKGKLNNGAIQSVPYTGTPTSATGAGTLMDFRTGWTDMGVRQLAVGTDALTDAQAQNLLAWAIQQAASANAAGT